MPGQDPSKIDLQEIDNWLSSRNADGICPTCGHDKWVPPKRPLALLTFTGEGKFHPNQAAIVAPYTCTNCAYVRLHSPGLLKATQT